MAEQRSGASTTGSTQTEKIQSEQAGGSKSLGLCDQQKARADILLAMFDRFYTNFDQRRSYEWKLSLAIWTALAVFISLTFKGELKMYPRPALWPAGGLVLVLWILHGLFLYFIRRANDADKKKAYFFEDELLVATQVCKRGYADVPNVKEAIDRTLPLISLLVQWLITLALLLGVILVVWWSLSYSSGKVASPEKTSSLVLAVDPNTMKAVQQSVSRTSSLTMTVDPSTLQVLRQEAMGVGSLTVALDPNTVNAFRRPTAEVISLIVALDPNTLKALKSEVP